MESRLYQLNKNLKALCISFLIVLSIGVAMGMAYIYLTTSMTIDGTETRYAGDNMPEDFDPDIDEFQVSGLTPESSIKVSPPKVKESKINLECKLNQIVEIGDGTAGSGFVVLGTIVLFHIDDDIYEDGHILLDKLEPLGRLAGNWYTRPTDNLKITRQVKPK